MGVWRPNLRPEFRLSSRVKLRVRVWFQGFGTLWGGVSGLRWNHAISFTAVVTHGMACFCLLGGFALQQSCVPNSIIPQNYNWGLGRARAKPMVRVKNQESVGI